MRRLLALLLLGGSGACDDVSAARPDASKAPSEAALEAAALAQPDASASFEDLPDAGLADLDVRGRHLLEALAQNDAALAADVVLPREAYVAARDAQDPGALYDAKFKTSFAAHVARTHRHEKGSERAVFVSFEIGQNPTRITPKKHEWREPLWRVARSTLTFTIDGRVHRIDVAEMVAWRGNWYVSRLRS